MLSFMRSVGYMEEKYWYNRCMQMIIVTFNSVIISVYNYNFHISYPMVTKRLSCDLVFFLLVCNLKRYVCEVPRWYTECLSYFEWIEIYEIIAIKSSVT